MTGTMYGDRNICVYETIMYLKNGEVYYVYSNELPQTLGYIFVVHAEDGSPCGYNVTEHTNYIVKYKTRVIG